MKGNVKAALIVIVLVILSIIILSCAKQIIPPTTLKDNSNNSHYIKESTYEESQNPDSAWIKAYLYCDSMGRVTLKELNQLKGERVFQSINTSESGKDMQIKVSASDNAKIRYIEKIKSDTVYRTKEVAVPYPVVEVTNVLKWWQKMFIIIGIALLSYEIGRITIKYTLKPVTNWLKKFSFLNRFFD